MDREKNNAVNMLIGRELQIERMRMQITQQQISDYLGETPETVSRWENGTKPMNLDEFFMICNHFGFDAVRMIRSVISRF